MKPKKLEELQEIARKMTFAALERYEIPEEYRPLMTLGVFFEGESRVFELYVTGETPQDAKVISQARINSLTGEGSVKIFGLKRKPTPTPDSFPAPRVADP